MKKQIVNVFFILLWVLLFFLLLFGFNRWHIANKGGIVQHIVSEKVQHLVLKAGRDHHFRFKGRINNQDVMFLVDTGASKVAIPLNISKKLGLKKQYPVKINTANGVAKAYLTRIHSLELGPIQLHNISALIMTQSSGSVLLGMSALKYLELKQEDGNLHLLKKRKP